MSDFYELKKIEGKIYGCFALKDIKDFKEGTLILSKSPECVAEGGDNYPAYRTDPDEFQKIYRDFVRYCKAMSKIHLHKLFNEVQNIHVYASINCLFY